MTLLWNDYFYNLNSIHLALIPSSDTLGQSCANRGDYSRSSLLVGSHNLASVAKIFKSTIRALILAFLKAITALVTGNVLYLPAAGSIARSA